MSSTEKTGMAMTAMHRYLQQQAFKVFLGYMKALAHNYRQGRYDDRYEWTSRLAAEAYSHLIDKELIYDPEFAELKPWRGYRRGTIVGRNGYRFIIEVSSGATIELYEDEIEFD